MPASPSRLTKRARFVVRADQAEIGEILAPEHRLADRLVERMAVRHHQEDRVGRRLVDGELRHGERQRLHACGRGSGKWPARPSIQVMAKPSGCERPGDGAADMPGAEEPDGRRRRVHALAHLQQLPAGDLRLRRPSPSLAAATSRAACSPRLAEPQRRGTTGIGSVGRARRACATQARSAGANGSKASVHRAAAALAELRPEREVRPARAAPPMQQLARLLDGGVLQLPAADRAADVASR